MGYMGFGMRKEVYTRKPKKAFDKIKKHTIKHPYKIPQDAPADREVYVHRYQKPAYQQWWFYLLVALTLGGAAYFYLETRVWTPARIEAERILLDKDDLLDHFFQNKGKADQLFRVLNMTEGGLVKAGISDYNGAFKLELRSRSRITGYRKKITLSENTPYQYFIENDQLMYRWNDATMKETDSWEVSIFIENIAELEQSTIDHINLPENQLADLIARLKQEVWMLEVHARGFIWHFNQHDRWYTYYISNDIDKLVLKNTAEHIKPLMPGVYWNAGL